MLTAFLVCFNPDILENERLPYRGGQVLVLTKTNNALEVIMNRLEGVLMPSSSRNGEWERRSLPYYCKRSSAYTSRKDATIRYHNNQREDKYGLKEESLILSTFGSLLKLYLTWLETLGTHERVDNWVLANLKVIIIDEGSQCTILDILVFVHLFPAFDGIIIVMGDPHQMKPVAITTFKEARELLTRNMFSECSNSDGELMVPSANMCIQYRMHTVIMDLANDVTYGGMMRNGNTSARADEFATSLRRNETYTQRWSDDLFPKPPVLGPLVAYITSHASDGQFLCKHYINHDELNLAERIIGETVSTTYLSHRDIVFLSPYTEQCKKMKEICIHRGWGVGVHTVAAFQGDEAEVIILSLVRRRGGGSGFLDQEELVNVAITRPKQSLIIIGDMYYLSQSIRSSAIWGDVLASLESRRAPILEAQQFI